MDFRRTLGMTTFEKLFYLREKGEITDWAWEAHLSDPIFANYVKARQGTK